MHIDKKFDKANHIVDSYMIYEKAERLKFFFSVSEVGFWLWDVFLHRASAGYYWLKICAYLFLFFIFQVKKLLLTKSF